MTMHGTFDKDEAAGSSTEIIPRATIEAIVGYRNKALELYAEAHTAIETASKIVGLTAIMSAGTEFRQTRKSIAFRELLAKLGARYIDLPAGSFAEVGTYVNTIAIRIGHCSEWRWRPCFPEN